VSPALADSLGRMLCKEPDSRIELGKIRDHRWFSRTEYNAHSGAISTLHTDS
jgi:hypothetical protein